MPSCPLSVGPRPRDMKTLVKIVRVVFKTVGIALVVLGQLVLVMLVTQTGQNVTKTSFRQQQREAAETAVLSNQSPENMAAWQQEVRLAGNHVARQEFARACVVLVVLLGFEAIAIRSWRQHHAKNKPIA
jgi:hypothetical protein